MLSKATELKEKYEFTLVVNSKVSKFIDLLILIFTESLGANLNVLSTVPRKWNYETLFGVPINPRKMFEERNRRKMDLADFNHFVSKKMVEGFSEIWISNHPWYVLINNDKHNFRIIEFSHGLPEILLENSRFTKAFTILRAFRDRIEIILLGACRKTERNTKNVVFSLHQGNLPEPNQIAIVSNFMNSLNFYKSYFDMYIGDQIRLLFENNSKKNTLFLVPDFFSNPIDNVFFTLSYIVDNFGVEVYNRNIFLKMHPNSAMNKSQVLDMICKMNPSTEISKISQHIRFLEIDAPVELLCSYLSIDNIFSTMSTALLNIQNLYPNIQYGYIPSNLSKTYGNSQDLKFRFEYNKFEYFFIGMQSD
jgi:hypothetical protein